ncbi:MAG: hypothetical protein GY856_06070 [bacterium]|nr:hypothetical protein [bacterium]
MPTVHYPFQINYLYDQDGKLFPRLTFNVSVPENPSRTVVVDTYLDPGSERSLFDGWIGTALGLDVLSGSKIGYQTTMGNVLTATIHPVRLSHSELGNFEIAAGFTSAPIQRNLLGRDFFNFVQIGFRERHQVFYVSPEP